jgi:hypothetical protein
MHQAPQTHCHALLLTVVLLAPACFAQSTQEAPLARVTLNSSLAVASHYMTHGFNVGDDKPNLQPTVTLGLPGAGLNFTYWASLPLDRGENRFDEHDVAVAWGNTLSVAGMTVPVRLGATYFHYPNQPVFQNRYGRAIQPVDHSGMKFSAGISSPSLTLGGAVVTRFDYDVYRWVPLHHDLFAPGTAQEIGLDLALPTLAQDSSDFASLGAPSLHVAINHHDGAFGVNPGWSHAYARLSLPFRLGPEFFQLDLTRQWSWEKTVSPDNENWAMLSWLRQW